MNRTKLLLILSLLLLLAGCSQGEKTANQAAANTGDQASANGQTPPTKVPPTDVVRASADPVLIKAGSGEASVKLTVANGYHINANPPSFNYLIATTLQLQPDSGITADAPVYPASITKKFKFSPQPLAVYEGDVVIKVKLNARSGVYGEHKVGAKVRVQPCDEESCYQPRTIEASIPVIIK